MKIAITAAEPSLEAKVDPRFGRSPYFLIVDPETMLYEAIENPNVSLGGGAGIQSAILISEKGANLLLTGNCGPNAYRTLSAADIGVIVGCSGVVRNTIEQFKTGQYSTASEPNVASHFGMGGAGGRGMGRGRGMGDCFPGTGFPEPQAPVRKPGKKEELEMLKQQAEEMIRQTQQIQERIRQLEKEK
ncbi:MAG TPA: NifB/NifX family molybdenum-iron cluster-binding protein [archaeon]|nr:NifB/NifX family molybdenum-iron cluster-binding protein [archaeon]